MASVDLLSPRAQAAGTRVARTGGAALRKWGAIVGAGLALSCAAAPAGAAVVVFQDTFGFDQSGFKSVFLPKYRGLGRSPA